MESIYNTYSTIVPSQMSNRELTHMLIELQTRINWGLDEARVNIKGTGQYDVPVSQLADYQGEVDRRRNRAA